MSDLLLMKRFGLLTMVLVAGVAAAMAAVWGRAHPTAPPLQTVMAEQLGEHGAEEWIELQHRYGSRYSRNAEEWVVRDYFHDKRDGIFLDVGANDPRADNNTYFLETALGWSGIAIDAMGEFAADYVRYRPRTKFFALFVSDVSDATEDFFVPEQGPLGASNDRAFAERAGGYVDVRKVRTITLNDLLLHEKIAHVDFVSIDIELSEPKALAGFDVERYRPGLVCIEAHPPVRQAILDYFQKHHFVLAGKYLRVDPQNLYFMPAASTIPQ
jgi:FkbM family methyltransferase